LFARLEVSEQKPIEQPEELMKRLTTLWIFAILLTACVPKPQDIFDAWQEDLNKGDIEAALSHLADDVVVSVVPAGPDGDGMYEGQDEVRGWYETIVAGKGAGTLSDCQADGDTFTCVSSYADEGLKAMGVDFIQGSWVAVVHDGKIQSYTFTISPESLAKFPPPPTAAPAEPLVEEVRITAAETLVGNWMGKSSEYSVLHRFQADGRLVVSVSGYGTIGTGPYLFEGDLLKFEDATGDCMGIVARYEVYGIYEGGELSKLRFVLDGDDACTERRNTLDGQTLVANP
jgi:ketosteroid isomerase-like protein